MLPSAELRDTFELEKIDLSLARKGCGLVLFDTSILAKTWFVLGHVSKPST